MPASAIRYRARIMMLIARNGHIDMHTLKDESDVACDPTTIAILVGAIAPNADTARHPEREPS